MTVANLTSLRSWLRWPDALNSEIAIGVGGGLLLLFGLGSDQPAMVGAGAVGVCMVCRNLASRENSWLWETGASRSETPRNQARRRAGSPTPESPEQRQGGPDAPAARPRRAETERDLVDQMLAQGRYALLLRPETASQLQQEQYIRAIRALDEAMVLTPAGAVLVGVAAERETLGHDATAGLLEAGSESVVRVEPCYVDRFAVTNADFQSFIDAGGYEELEFWSEEAFPPCSTSSTRPA